MPNERYVDPDTKTPPTTDRTELSVTDESIVLRNYDDTATHTVTVRLRGVNGAVAFERTYELAPSRTRSLRTRLPRGVYTAEARREHEPTSTGDPTDSEPVLVGSGPDETALVELGNGLVSVSDGVV